jgi:hypothetical protein
VADEASSLAERDPREAVVGAELGLGVSEATVQVITAELDHREGRVDQWHRPSIASAALITAGVTPAASIACSSRRSKFVVRTMRTCPRCAIRAIARWAAVGNFNPAARSSSVGSRYLRSS